MNMTKKVLKLNYENEFDFLVAGLISAYRDFRVCFELNELLNFNMLRGEDVVVPAGKPGSNTRHSYFMCRGRNSESYHIISNRDKDGTGYFIPEMRNIDYFLLISEAPGSFDMNGLVRSVRKIDIISGVFEVEPAEMKSAEAFLLFLER